MARSDFGFLLRQARERRGYDLNSAARRLRIRPDVLQAIESCDFERMPPRGYARNMVNAYARMVGLNATEITRMYLDGVHDYQRGKQQDALDGRASGFDMPGNSRTSRVRQDASRASSRSSRGGGRDELREEGVRSFRRSAARYGSDDSFARDDLAGRSSSRPGRSVSESRTERVRYDRTDRDVKTLGVPFGGLGALQPLGNPNSGKNSRRGGYSSSSESPLHPSMYSAPMQGGVLQGRLPIILAGVAILILLVIVISLLTGGGDKQEEQMPSVPVTGLTDTTVTEGEETNAVATAPVPAAPTKVTLTYSVADGMQAYIEMYADGASSPTSAATLTGPTEESVDVTGTLRFVTAAPDAVTLKVDGKQVELTQGAAGAGVYEYTVDFNQYLVTWYEEHPEASPGAQAQKEDTSAASGSATTTN